MTDKCLDINVIPQYGGTCWLNAVMMSALYSQGSNYFVKKASRKWDKNNSLLRFFKKVIYSIEKNPKLVQKLFKRIKPEIILFKLLEQSKNEELIKDFMKNNELFHKLGYTISYITNFYKFLGLKVLDIYSITREIYEINLCNIDEYFYRYVDSSGNVFRYFDTDKFSKDKNKNKKTTKIINDIPDIIVLYNDSLFPIRSLYFEYSSKKKIFKDNILENITDSNIKGIKTYDDIIVINSIEYKLDSVLISNYNYHDTNGHAIAGITCNNNKYVYNGWSKISTDPAQIIKNENGSVNPCSLMKYDWDLNKNEKFCLNPETCKLNFEINKKDLCFSFNKGHRILIYSRIIKDKTKSESQNESNVSSKVINEMSKIDEIIFKIYDIDNQPLQILKNIYSELFSKLKYINPNDINKPIEELREIIKPLLVEYFYKFNKSNKINEYFKNIDKLDYFQLYDLYKILINKYKLKLNNKILENKNEVIREYLKNTIKKIKNISKSSSSYDIKKVDSKSKEKDTKSIILSGKKYKLDKSKCNEWISNNKEKNPFTNRKIAANSPISKTLEKECLNFGIKKVETKNKDKSKDKDTKSIILSGKKYKLDKSKCNEWISNNKEKNPFTNRKIAANSPISKTLEKECLKYI